MELALNIGAFEALDNSELFSVDGGGNVSLFLSCVGIAVSPLVACFNPWAGAGLFLVSLGVFIDNVK